MLTKWIFVTGFSLSTYARERGLDLNNITDRDFVYLNDHMGVSSFLPTTLCNKSDELYTPAVSGWKNGKNTQGIWY